MIDRDVRQRGEKIAGHHDLLAPDAIRKRAEEDEERRAEQERDRDDHVRRDERHLEHGLQEEQRVELARVPDHRLSGRRAEQHEKKTFHVRPVPKLSLIGAVDVLPSSFRRANSGDSASRARM